jgi:hypothetical protein
MGRGWEDRLHLRRLEALACIVGFAVGAALPAGSLVGEPGRLLTTFFGLVAASILPTVSLIVGGMVTGSRSVKQLSELGDELERTVSALFAIFGLIAAAAVVLMALAVPVPFGDRLPTRLQALPSIFAQGVIAVIAILVVVKSGTIPGAIRRSLELKTEMAVLEARKKTLDNANDAGSKMAFKTREGFGRVKTLSEVRSSGREEESPDEPTEG